MTLAEFQDTVIKLTLRNLIVLIIGVGSIVSSFWIGWGKLNQGQKDTQTLVLNAISELSRKQELRDQKQDFDIENIKSKLSLAQKD